MRHLQDKDEDGFGCDREILRAHRHSAYPPFTEDKHATVRAVLHTSLRANESDHSRWLRDAAELHDLKQVVLLAEGDPTLRMRLLLLPPQTVPGAQTDTRALCAYVYALHVLSLACAHNEDPLVEHCSRAFVDVRDRVLSARSDLFRSFE